jgi:hypothetical protein
MATSEQHVVLPIEWHTPEGLVSRYVSNLVVQHTEHEFIISFFEILPPLLLGTPEEQQARLTRMNAIQAECVARIIVSPEQMPTFIQAMQTVLEKYRSFVASRDQG